MLELVRGVSLREAYQEADARARLNMVMRRWSPNGPGFKCDIIHRRDGKIIAQALGVHNLLHDEGEEAILSAYFATSQSGFGAPPANLYMGLRTNAAAEADTLASGTTEVSGTSYARIAISTTSGWTLSQVSGDWRATSASVVFTAGGTWTGAVALFICTVSSGTSGKLIMSVATSATRTLLINDTLTCSCYIVMSE